MADIGKAYVQIIPKADGISSKVEGLLGGGAASGGKKAGNAAGSGMLSGITKVMTVAAVGAPIVAGVKAALSEGAALEQSYIGGLDTLYGESADRARELAREASSAGISMNNYAEQAVSFGAALKQSFEGDTAKAVEAANTAILDMADNAAKMGTPLENIQNAYQGFAKGNYTMLDNLKLGYGGTKTEMERLLADAQKISGVKYDISNLGDVYDAIHVVQGELGLTGVAAAEASETFSGSFNAMKAAAANLFGSMALEGGDITGSMKTLLQSVSNFLFKNAIPMVGRVFKAIPTAVGELIKEGGPQLLASGKELITNVMDGAKTALPEIGTKAKEIVENIRTALTTEIPALLQQGQGIMTQIQDGITEALPGVLSQGREIVLNLLNGAMDMLPTMITTISNSFAEKIKFIGDNMPVIMEEGGKFIAGIADAVVQHAPEILEALQSAFESLKDAVGPALEKIGGVIITHGPELLSKGKDLFLNLLDGFLEGLPEVLAELPGIVGDIVNGLTDFLSTNLPQMVETGAKAAADFVGDIGKTIMEHAPEVLPAIGEIVLQAGQGLNDLTAKGLEIAGNVVKALADGLGVSDAIDKVGTAVTNIVNTIRRKFLLAVSAVKGVVNSIKNIIIMTGIPAKVASTFETVRSSIKKKLDAAKSVVEGVVNKIKGFFPLSIGNIFTNLKLPHINVSGGTPPYGIAGMGTLPHFSIDWYAKGAIVDGPSVVGVGEKGREAIIPLSGANMRPFADAIAEGIGDNGSTYNFYITVDGAENPEQFADRLMRQVQMRARMA